jgi:hypothetical protein
MQRLGDIVGIGDQKASRAFRQICHGLLWIGGQAHIHRLALVNHVDRRVSLCRHALVLADPRAGTQQIGVRSRRRLDRETRDVHAIDAHVGAVGRADDRLEDVLDLPWHHQPFGKQQNSLAAGQRGLRLDQRQQPVERAPARCIVEHFHLLPNQPGQHHLPLRAHAGGFGALRGRAGTLEWIAACRGDRNATLAAGDLDRQIIEHVFGIFAEFGVVPSGGARNRLAQ